MRFTLILVLVAGCGTTPNPKSCLDNHCSDPNLPFCDVDGSIGGEPNTCIAVNCMPNVFEECRGDRALTCNATGDNYELVECEFGCGSTGCNPCNGPQCEARITPRYTPSVCETMATSPSLTIAADMTLDTSIDANCSSRVPQTSGPEICVLRHDTITIVRGKTLTVTGTRALALVADHELLVDGILDASASFNVGGPGGGTIVSGESTAAGGGAGYRTAGGSGGSTSANGGAANGGPARMNPTLLTTLLGGPRSHTNRNNGGGALSLVSCRGAVNVYGLIDAGGGAGLGGAFSVGTGYRQPAGGGAGGTVVLQGLFVTVTGEIYANGGGGGAGGTNGAPGGSDALQSTSQAPGGNAPDGADGDGGNGGAAITAASDGSLGQFPGAGGGSAGFILFYTPASSVPTLTPIAISPPPEPKQTL